MYSLFGFIYLFILLESSSSSCILLHHLCPLWRCTFLSFRGKHVAGWRSPSSTSSLVAWVPCPMALQSTAPSTCRPWGSRHHPMGEPAVVGFGKALGSLDQDVKMRKWPGDSSKFRWCLNLTLLQCDLACNKLLWLQQPLSQHWRWNYFRDWFTECMWKKERPGCHPLWPSRSSTTASTTLRTLSFGSKSSLPMVPCFDWLEVGRSKS